MPRLERLTLRAARDALAARPRLRVRAAARYTNVVLASLVVAVLLTGTGSLNGTFAFFNTTTALASNGVATAKLFALTDVTAVAKAAGTNLISWSDASWATNGYSVKRGTVITGPFTQIGTTAASVVSYSDGTGVDGTTYYYVVRGLSGLGGSGMDSNVASAVVDATRPTVSSTDPPDQSTAANMITPTMVVTFSEPMEQASTAANFALVACAGGGTNPCTPGAAVPGVLSWQSSSVLYFVPTVALGISTDYGIKLTGGAGAATDLAGNTLNATSGCQTANISGNTCYRAFSSKNKTLTSGVLAAAPGGGTTGVGVGTKIMFTFNLAAPGSNEKTDLQNGFSMSPNCPSCGATPYPSSRFAWTNGTMTYTPPAALAASTTYTVTDFVDPNSSSSNAGSNYSTSFTTGAGTDSTAPTVQQVVPNTGATGIPVSSPVQLTFSEQMRPEVTITALTLKPFTTGCSGATGTAVAGLGTWTSPTTILTFTPTANLTVNQCYQVNLATSATDPSGNALASAFSSTFTTLSGTAPTVTLTGSLYYSGASVSSSGAGWTTGSGNVIPKWDDGTTLDATGAVVASNAFAGYAFTIPTGATAGTHYIQFTRSTGPTVLQPITVRLPTSVVLTASLTDIAAGGSSTITATAYDGGQPANNAGVSFSKTDPSARGTLTPASGVSNASGQVPTTLSVSAGGVFSNITVTGTSGAASSSIVIIDPPPLPPTALRLSATPDRLTISWTASPTKNVRGYRVSLGTVTGTYDPDVDVGPLTTYTASAVQAEATYYAVVRAYNDEGALSDATAEVSVSIPARIASQLTLSAQGVNLSATLLDQAGKPVGGVLVMLSGPAGVTLEPSSGMSDAQGVLRSLASASDPSLATATIRATSGSLTANAEVTFLTASPTPTATPSQTVLVTLTTTASPTTTATATATATVSVTPTVTPTIELSVTPSPTPTSGATETATPTPTPMPVTTPTLEPTPTIEATGTATPTVVQTATSTAVVVSTSTLVATPTSVPTATNTAIPTYTATPTLTPTVTSTPSATSGAGTPTVTPTPVLVCGPTVTPTATSTATPNPATLMPTAVVGTATPTPTSTAVPTCVPTMTPTATATPSSTSTPTPGPSATASPTDVSALTTTPTATPPSTATPTSVPIATSTAVPTNTATPTSVPTATSTPIATSTATPISTATNTPPPTATPRPSATPTPTGP